MCSSDPTTVPSWLTVGTSTIALASGTYSDLAFWPVSFSMATDTALIAYLGTAANRLTSAPYVAVAGDVLPAGAYLGLVTSGESNYVGTSFTFTLEQK